ncbi:NAD+ synthase [Serpentinimonas raichei]|uniref:NAD+ synthase n=1 Tax=Serpentinimonas raichei TaxID=1458425 RepID=UPI000AC33CB6
MSADLSTDPAAATLPICVAQLNPVVGDLAGNVQQIAAAARAAHAQGARLLLTPELALCGYPAEDLLLRPAFVADCEAALQELARLSAEWPGLHLVLGHPAALAPSHPADEPAGGHGRTRCLNAASVLADGQVRLRYAKRELPNYQVFDEQRTFVPGQGVGVFDLPAGHGQRLRIGLLICEDAWYPEPAAQSKAAGAELLLVLNASPYHWGKGAQREQVMRQRVAETGLPLVYAHLVGAQDEVVFEGRSFALDADGRLAARAASFVPELLRLEAIALPRSPWQLSGPIAPVPEPLAELWQALVLGLRDYVEKNGFPGALLGLSGGIDSALVLALAVDALGPARVRTLMLPSPYSAEISLIDAREMAARLGVRHEEVSIQPVFEALLHTLEPLFEGRAPDLTEENLQARIRGVLLMALSNKFGAIVLTTGNKSELATGYCTLYGDMAGGFAVLKDVPKTRVFELARWRNAHDPCGGGANPIPERIITRPPSAELRPNQTDQDSLPPYELLDAIVERYVEQEQSAAEIIAAGYPQAAVEQVLRLLRLSEYKRRQGPLGTRVTPRSFGKDWRYPNTNRYRG